MFQSTNQSATISGTSTGAVTEDANVTTEGKLIATETLTVSDPDANQNSFNTTVTSATGNLGTLTITADGAWSYSVANSVGDIVIEITGFSGDVNNLAII